MTNTPCQACRATGDAPLCRACTAKLADTLKLLPALVDELLTTATKQARLGETSGQGEPIEDQQAVAEERKITARLRSRAGRITLPATAMPVAFGAAQLHRQAVAGIRDWLSRIDAEPYPERPIAHTRTAVIIWRNRAWAVRSEVLRGELHPAQQAAWLAGHAEQIRHIDTAGEIHARALDLVAAIEATIDRRDPDQFAGLCDAPGLHVDQIRYAGPPCTSLACPHDSCEQLRAGRTVLQPIAGECGGELNAAFEATTVTCPTCGREYDVAEQTAKLADKMADKLGTVREVAGFLRTLTVDVDGEDRQLEVTVDKVNGWLSRHRITDHGNGPRGKLVKVGEVRAYAEALAARAKSRKRERISA